jgi:thymidylate synthase (FAD)
MHIASTRTTISLSMKRPVAKQKLRRTRKMGEVSVVPQSFTLLDEHDHTEDGIVKQIEERGRICYKSEDKITALSAYPFFNKVKKAKHLSVLEMASLSLLIQMSALDRDRFYRFKTKYIDVSSMANMHRITGSIRAFMEWAETAPEHCRVAHDVSWFLHQKYPGIFSQPLFPASMPHPMQPVIDIHRPVHPQSRVAVRIVTNRAVSHELVRHRPASFLQESQRYVRYNGDIQFISPCFFGVESEEYALWLRGVKDAAALYCELLAASSPQAARTVLPNSTKTELIIYTSLEHWCHIFRLRNHPACDPSMVGLMSQLEPAFRQKHLR